MGETDDNTYIFTRSSRQGNWTLRRVKGLISVSGQVKPSQVAVAISRGRLPGEKIFLFQIVDYSYRPN